MGLRARPEPVINERGVHVTLDGVDLTNDVTGGTLSAPPVGALSELSVTTFGVKAEQGRSNDAAVHLNTKAGSNTWHGTASFFRRGNQWSALPATIDRGGDVPSFGRSQYSGALGGPIVKDHAFWFGSFEYLRQRTLLQSGERDIDARATRNKPGATPLDSTLGLLRADWVLSDRDRLSALYAAERSDGRTRVWVGETRYEQEVLRRSASCATAKPAGSAKHLYYANALLPGKRVIALEA